MANAILRAGAYASSSNPFISNPPVPQDFSDLVLPVNCNRSDWVNDSWKALVIRSNEADNLVEEVLPNSGGAITLHIGTLDRPANFEGIYFRYQAVSSFSISGNFSIDTIDHTFGIGSFSNKNLFFSSSSSSGTFSVTLPRAVVPRFVGLTFKGNTDKEVGEGSITIDNLKTA